MSCHQPITARTDAGDVPEGVLVPVAHGEGALVPLSSFGPFDALAEWAHRLYLDGYGERAVTASREGLVLVEAAGDERTARYLQFVCGVALHQLGRWTEASEEAGHLLRRLGPEADPLWRAKALALLAEARVDLGMTALAMDHLAEGRMIVAGHPGGDYSHLSATMSVALALRALALYEPADELMLQMLGAGYPSASVRLNVAQEAAVLQVSWGAMLEIVGRPDEARPHYVVALERAARMRALAHEVAYPEMLARAEVIEGYVLQRAGDVDLAEARLRPAMSAFRLREELAETQIARIGLALVLGQRGRFASAEPLLADVVRSSSTTQLDVWGLTALASQARNAVREQGPHTAVAPLQVLTRTALARLWEDRESRFESLQDRIRLREMAQESDRLGRAALEDPVTGLGNRRRLQQVLERPDRRFSAVFVALDRFKQVNDEQSHEVGDDVLRRFSKLLVQHCRGEDVVIRYGGDEFVVLLPAEAPAGGADEGVDPMTVATRLLAAVRAEPWSDLSRGLKLTASIGVSGPAPAAEALSAADAACAVAKRSGRDRAVRT
jgi:diguanylate cyclase (GGDEF)-like protein